MIPSYLSSMWAAIAPALGNHLWQSTIFAGVAGLLTLGLRKDHARVRYWLWFAASLTRFAASRNCFCASVASSANATAGTANVAGNNLLEQLIQMQAQLLNTTTPQSIATA